MRMPGMTGLELFEMLVACGDRIPTVLITAHPEAIRAIACAPSRHHVLSQQAVRTRRTARMRTRSVGEIADSSCTKVVVDDPCGNLENIAYNHGVPRRNVPKCVTGVSFAS